MFVMKNPWDINKSNLSNHERKESNDFNEKLNQENESDKKIVFEFTRKSKKMNFIKNQMNFIFFIFLLIFFLWIIQGIYKVNSDENAAVLYFGKYHETTKPGLHFYIPYPIGEIKKASVTTINKEDFGFSNNGNIGSDQESLMLTGDENIADVDFEVQWKIKSVEDYLFNIKDQKNTIRSSTESVMREVIANRNIDDVLANKKFEIETTAKDLLQRTLDSYNSGIEIITVQLLRADPPKEVIDAFRDVQTAKADKERKINDAESYKNDIIPKARGESEAIIQNAESYKKSIVDKAEGETQRFNKIYTQYKANKSITKERIYIETMEEIYKNNNKVIIDNKLNNNFIKFLDK